jgi:hypothetical protein
MTIDNWLAIALIVTTAALVVTNLIVTRIEIVKLRMNRPNRTPEPSQPAGWLVRFIQSPRYWPPFLILSNIYVLVVELRRTSPITRWAVYEISAAVAGVLYGAVLILLNIAWQSIRRQWQINAEQVKIDREIVDILRSVANSSNTTDEKIIDLLRSLANGLHTTAETLALEQKVRQLQTEQDELEKSRQGRLRRLLKGLFGD